MRDEPVGRLHQTAVVMLAPHLKKSPDALGLLEAAASKSRSQIALLIAERFPRPDVPTSVGRWTRMSLRSKSPREAERHSYSSPRLSPYEADRVFGAGFMAEKRAQVREPNATVAPDVSTPSETEVPEPQISTVPEQVELTKALPSNTETTPHDPDLTALLAQRADIIACLRTFDFRLAVSKRAAAWCDHLLGQSPEVCVKYALQQLVMPRFKRCSPWSSTVSGPSQAATPQ